MKDAMLPQSVSAADKVMAEASSLFDEYSGRSEGTSAPATATTNPQLFRGQVANPVYTNQRSPNIEILEEKPQHQIMVFLKAQGYTNKEIAKATGYTEAWVSQVTRQPWFKTRLADAIKEAGTDAVKTFLVSEALPSLEALANIRDNEKAPAAARVAAANAVLDRAFGKPTQHIQSESTVNVKNAKQTADALEQELQSINEQLKARGQPVHN